ncbi:pilus assembly protein TadG-related protein [Streptomyces sp. NPDC006284]|uniref:pilus assembly protein TadG-related protein n=1 Tax=Streptomyces sp. NPDC006284 TaxID=3156742 RepID=UPI0033BB6B6E
MALREDGDAGQAFPIYITVVGGLLFLALAYLAVGQAAATRSEAQTAADAAALAAALETRDYLAGEWLTNVLEPDTWQDIFTGDVPTPDACWRAHELAASNDASVDCTADGMLRYTVVAETNGTVGDTIVPGTEDQRATESASAVIEARCDFKPLAEDAGDDVLPVLSCKGEDWEFDPDDLSVLPEPEDLFDVHLAD